MKSLLSPVGYSMVSPRVCLPCVALQFDCCTVQRACIIHVALTDCETSLIIIWTDVLRDRREIAYIWKYYNYIHCNWDQIPIFTMWISYVSAVLGIIILSVGPYVCLSVRHTHALWRKEITYCRYFATIWKDNHSSFLIPTRIGGRCPLPPELMHCDTGEKCQ